MNIPKTKISSGKEAFSSQCSHRLCKFKVLSFFFSLYGDTCSIWKLPGWGQIRATSVQAASVTYSAACSNTRYLTHWTRAGSNLGPHRTPCQVLKLPSHSRNSQTVIFMHQAQHGWALARNALQNSLGEENSQEQKQVYGNHSWPL